MTRLRDTDSDSEFLRSAARWKGVTEKRVRRLAAISKRIIEDLGNLQFLTVMVDMENQYRGVVQRKRVRLVDIDMVGEEKDRSVSRPVKVY